MEGGVKKHLTEVFFSTGEAAFRDGTYLVAQCSAARDSVAATPPCSAIHCRMESTCNTSMDKIGQQGLLLGVARPPHDILEIAGICCDTVCAMVRH